MVKFYFKAENLSKKSAQKKDTIIRWGPGIIDDGVLDSIEVIYK